VTVLTTGSDLIFYPGTAMAWQALDQITYDSAAELVVHRLGTGTAADTLLARDVDYAVSGDGTAGAGQIRALTVRPADERWMVERATSLTQQRPFPARQPFPSASAEGGLDKLTRIVQELLGKAARAITVPRGETGLTIPRAADRAGRFAAWGPTGDFISASGTGADAGLRTDLAEPDGLGLSGFQQSGSGMATSTGLVIMRRAGLYLTDHAGADPTGAAASTAAFNAVAAEAVASGRALKLPKGVFKITNAALPAGLIIEGMGEDSQLIVGANNSNIFSAAAGKVRLMNMRMTGDATANASTNGMAIYGTGVADLFMDTMWFDNFAGAGFFLNTSDAARRLEVRNAKFLAMLNWGATKDSREDGAIKVYGGMRWAHIENVLIEAAAGNGTTLWPLNNGVVFATIPTTSQYINEITMRSVIVKDVGKRGVSMSHEAPDPAYRVGVVTLDDIRVYRTGWSGIKTKYVDRVRGTNWYAEDCEQGATFETISNLQGSFYINGTEDLQLTNLQAINCGTDGLRLNGRNTGFPVPLDPGVFPFINDLGNDDGRGQARQFINGLQIKGTKTNAAASVGAGLQYTHSGQALVVNGFQGYDCFRGIEITSSASLSAPRTIILNSPILRRSVQDGIRIVGLSGINVGRVQINNAEINEAGRNGILVNLCDQLQIDGGSITDSGTALTATSRNGITFANTAIASIRGVRSGNIGAGTSQENGISVGAGNGTVNLFDNNLDGNAAAPVAYTAPTKMRAANNSPWLEATSGSFDPPSLALGASTALQAIAITGAALGDDVTVTWSADLIGAEIKAFVSSAGNVRWWIHNAAGANPLDLAAGTASFTITKRLG
jgi:hypothetical protein